MSERKYLPTLSELIDRLSICQLKEVFITEHKEEYAQEMKDITHDIDLILKEYEIHVSNGPGELVDESCSTQIVSSLPKTTKSTVKMSELIRSIIVLSQMNLHIWQNESKARRGDPEGNLRLTHGLNGIRNTAKNKIQAIFGGRQDFKIDALAADFKDWNVSW